MKRGIIFVLSVAIFWSDQPGFGTDHWLPLEAGAFRLIIEMDEMDLSLTLYDDAKNPTWKSLGQPTIDVEVMEPTGESTPVIAAFDKVIARHTLFEDGVHKGYRIHFSSFQKSDAEIYVIVALSVDGELLVEVEQDRGHDSIQRVMDLHTWGVKPQPNAWLVFPWRSGYLISAESSTSVEKSGLIGASYTLPIFALIRGDKNLYKITETWWDAPVVVRHVLGERTTVALHWEPSLGTLQYKRRILYRFADNLDHTDIAKAYRNYLNDHKQFSTLRDRLERTPQLKRHLAGIEYRMPHWNKATKEQTLKNICHFQEASLPVSFFYPKWPLRGPETPYSAAWQSFLMAEPVPGGWGAMCKYASRLRELGCTIKVMINTHSLHKDMPGYEPKMESGVSFPKLNDRYAVDMVKQVLDFIEQQGFRIDALYFDGHAAHSAHSEHKTVSRRESFDAQNASFREARRRGLIPGAELTRFWCLGESDCFFFTDWSNDRFRDGEPIPLFPFIFHDCYAAHFSGEDYYNEGKYDWYEDRNPRLYELMYAAAPSHNWLPDGSRDIGETDWETEQMQRRLSRLRKWHTYYQKICYSEMITHRFLNADHTMQQVEFANGVVADFDLDKGLFRVRDVEGFIGDWKNPETIERLEEAESPSQSSTPEMKLSPGSPGRSYRDSFPLRVQKFCQEPLMLIHSMIAITLLGTLLTPSTANGKSDAVRYVRCQVDKKVIYGIVEGQKVREISGDLFGSWHVTNTAHNLEAVRILVPTTPSKVFAIAGNYSDHLGNTDPAKTPQPFIKLPSCLQRNEGNVELPDHTTDIHYEAEVVIVIGKRAKNVSETDALKYVFGITCGNDISARKWQKGDIQWWRAKASDTFGPCGPFILSMNDYRNLDLTLRVNGEVLQKTNTSNMIHNVAQIVSFISKHCTLEPGDLIFSGTPGKTMPLKPGDLVEVEIEKVGILKNKVVNAKSCSSQVPVDSK